MSKPFADMMKMSDAELDAAKQWRMHDAGIGAFAWFNFRCEVGKLSVREKLRPTHWQRDLEWFFMGHVAVAGLPQDEKQERLIARVITDMMNESRVWCNPQIGVDEPAARIALRKAFDTILAAQDSIDTGVQPEDNGELSTVDMQDKTAQLVAELGL